jgi:peptidoglycan/LPS O-acetylase OafA/YrhL
MVATRVAAPQSAVEHSRRSGAVPGLTGARALAAMSVVVGHAFGYVPPFPKTQPIWFAEGRTLTNFGMALFFVLSGFVIHYNYSKEIVRYGRRALWNFYVARFARLYPLYIAVLAFIFIDYGIITNAVHGGYPYDVYMTTHDLPLFGTFTQSWVYFIYHGVPPVYSLIYESTAIMWSVSTEWFFYIAYPLMLFLLVRGASRTRLVGMGMATTGLAAAVFAVMFWRTSAINRLVAALFGSLAGTYGGSESSVSFLQWLIYYAPYLRVLEFFLGVLVAAIYMKSLEAGWSPASLSLRQARVGRRLIWGVAGLIAIEQGLTGLPWTSSLLNFFDFSCSYSMAVLMALWVLCLVCYQDGALYRALASRGLVAAGEASYSIYLLQFAAIGTLGYAFSNIDPTAGSTAFVVCTRTAVALAELVGLSLITQAVLERPARRWIRAKLSVNVAAASTSPPAGRH